MENQNTKYQEILNNLNNPEKVKEATTKRISTQDMLKELKNYYHKISHDDYYAAKSKLDKNVELKKKFREEIRKIELLKDKATLTDSEENEVIRISQLLKNKDKIPETEKIITEKINEIEEKLRELRVLMKNSFE